MNDRHWGFLLGSFWEVVRFAMILLAYLTLIMPLRQPLLFLFIIWNASLALSIAAAYIALALYPEKYGVYIHILRTAKIFSIIPGIAVFVLTLNFNAFIRTVPNPADPLFSAAESGAAEGNPYQLLRLMLISITILADVIFLLFLLLWGREKRKPETAPPPAEHLPLMEDVHMEHIRTDGVRSDSVRTKAVRTEDE